MSCHSRLLINNAACDMKLVLLSITHLNTGLWTRDFKHGTPTGGVLTTLLSEVCNNRANDVSCHHGNTQTYRLPVRQTGVQSLRGRLCVSLQFSFCSHDTMAKWPHAVFYDWPQRTMSICLTLALTCSRWSRWWQKIFCLQNRSTAFIQRRCVEIIVWETACSFTLFSVVHLHIFFSKNYAWQILDLRY